MHKLTLVSLAVTAIVVPQSTAPAQAAYAWCTVTGANAEPTRTEKISKPRWGYGGWHVDLMVTSKVTYSISCTDGGKKRIKSVLRITNRRIATGVASTKKKAYERALRKGIRPSLDRGGHLNVDMNWRTGKARPA